jgi:hypothetical protein
MIMRKSVKFILIGSFFAAVVELVKVLNGEYLGYLTVIIIPYLPFLLVVFYSMRLIDRRVKDIARAHIIHYLSYGILGLVVVEWLLIGLSPWSNPEANPIMMIVFQLAMLSYWGTVAFAPRMLLDDNKGMKKVKKLMMGFYIPYFVVAYIIGFSLPYEAAFPIVIIFQAIGHLLLNIFYYWFYRKLRNS